MALTPPGRVSFPELYQPKAAAPGATPKFSLLLMFKLDEMSDEDKAKLQAMKKAANDACVAEFGVGIGEEYRGEVIQSPFKKSEKKPDYMPPGYVYVRLSGKRRPAVLDQAKNPIPEHAPDEKAIYGGCWAHVSYGVYTYDMNGNRGVAFGLNKIQKLRDDEKFGGGDEDEFEDVSGGSSDDEFDTVSATVEGSDDIPF
jgi:hypothetical protein